jgi:hypothetical protein
MTGGRLFNATFVRNLCEAEKVEDVEILQGLPGQDRSGGVTFPYNCSRRTRSCVAVLSCIVNIRNGPLCSGALSAYQSLRAGPLVVERGTEREPCNCAAGCCINSASGQTCASARIHF